MSKHETNKGVLVVESRVSGGGTNMNSRTEYYLNDNLVASSEEQEMAWTSFGTYRFNGEKVSPKNFSGWFGDYVISQINAGALDK